MSDTLHVGVMGAGSIGCFVGGKLVSAGETKVTFIGRDTKRIELEQHGLSIKDSNNPTLTIPADQFTFTSDINALKSCHIVLCCVKSAQTREVGQQLAEVLAPDALVISLQNGLGNARILTEELPNHTVLACVVGFNVVTKEEGLYHCGMPGDLLMESSEHPRLQEFLQQCAAGQLPAKAAEDIKPDQWTKLLVNLNNAVSALTGMPTRQMLLTPDCRKLIAAIVDEALQVLKAAGIKPAKLRGVPPSWMPPILRMPTFLVRLVTGAQLKVDPEARSSMWEDLQRNRLTEVDFLNGELVQLAESLGQDAPLNRRITELIHKAEQANQGSPNISPKWLWQLLHS